MSGGVSEFSVIDLILGSSGGVQIIMFILLLSSLISWKLIFEYNNKIKIAEKEFDFFNVELNGSKGKPARAINSIYSGGKIKSINGIYKVFLKSFKFVNDSSSLLMKNSKDLKEGVDYRVYENDLISIYEETFKAEMDIAEQGLKNEISLLGTISATAPYVGLLGTVYGILIAFWGLGMSEQATVATVAPSIAEALIATGMGLFVAIPSLVAFNRLSHRVDVLLDQYDQVLKASTLLLKKKVILSSSRK